MITTGRRADSVRQTSSTPSTVAPDCSAFEPAAWMTGPSASGSENGTPSSTRSAPFSAQAAPIATVASRSGNPPIRYGMSAARPGAAAKAAPKLSVPGAKPVQDLPQILFAAAGQAHQVERVGGLQRPRDGVRGLERRDDALELRHPAQGGERLVVGDRHVARAATVA